MLDQLAPLLGLSPRGANELVQLADLLASLPDVSGPTPLTGVLALGILAGLGRTRLAPLSSLFALLVPSVLVVLPGWSAVQRVVDVSPIPRGVPVPALPDPGLLTPGLVLSAFSLAVIIAVQGAGVSQSVENPDGSPIDPSRDMVAQGAGNLLSGLLRGIPAGGSVGQTALNVSVGARSRWSGVFGGVWMLVFVLLVPGLVGEAPMAVLAALMIMAGLSAIDLREARSIWNTGGAARWSILVTFVATLVLSIPLAVGIGVLLTVLPGPMMVTRMGTPSSSRGSRIVPRLPAGRPLPGPGERRGCIDSRASRLPPRPGRSPPRRTAAVESDSSSARGHEGPSGSRMTGSPMPRAMASSRSAATRTIPTAAAAGRGTPSHCSSR